MDGIGCEAEFAFGGFACEWCAVVEYVKCASAVGTPGYGMVIAVCGNFYKRLWRAFYGTCRAVCLQVTCAAATCHKQYSGIAGLVGGDIWITSGDAARFDEIYVFKGSMYAISDPCGLRYREIHIGGRYALVIGLLA